MEVEQVTGGLLLPPAGLLSILNVETVRGCCTTKLGGQHTKPGGVSYPDTQVLMDNPEERFLEPQQAKMIFLPLY